MPELTLLQALNLALEQEMTKDESVVLLGEDVGVAGGIFRLTEGLHEKWPDRVFDTPLAEAGIVGASIGMAANGLKPVAEMQFSGFSYHAFYLMEGHAARMRKRSRGVHTVPMVLRMPYGAGVHALEHHSESREVYWSHTPGLKMVIPSTPRNARALMVSAIRDPDPVVFYEPKKIYRAFRAEVPEEEETLPIGEAHIEQEGDDLTLIAYGAMLHPTLEAAKELEADGHSVEVIDLRTISPLDGDTLTASIRKTGRCVVVHEAPRSFGPGAEIIARAMEDAFLYLEAPIKRVTGFDVPVPLFAREKWYMPDKKRVLHACREVLDF